MKVKNMIFFAVGPALAALISLVTLPFVAWFFSAEDVGRLTMLQIAIGLSVSLFSLQMHQAYVREYHEESDKKMLFKVAMLPGLSLLFLYLLFSFVFSLKLSAFLFGIESYILVVLLNISLVAMYFVNFFSHNIRMEENGFVFSVSQVLPKATLLILIGFILLTGMSNDFLNLILMNTAAAVVTCVVLAYYTRSRWSGLLVSKIDVHLMKGMLKFSMPLIAGGLAYWGITTVDRLFLRYFSGFEELGVYALASSIGGAVIVVSAIFSNIWHPIAYRWVAQGIDVDRLQFVIEGVLISVAFIWSCFGAFSWVITYVLPEKYYEIEYIVIACAAAPLLYMLSEATMIGIGVTRKPAYSMLASFLALATCLLLNFIFVPLYGALSAALVSMVSFFVFFVVRTESGNRLWVSLPRARVYFVVFLYITLTSVMVVLGDSLGSWYYKVSWVILFFATVAMFNGSFTKILSIVRI